MQQSSIIAAFPPEVQATLCARAHHQISLLTSYSFFLNSFKKVDRLAVTVKCLFEGLLCRKLSNLKNVHRLVVMHLYCISVVKSVPQLQYWQGYNWLKFDIFLRYLRQKILPLILLEYSNKHNITNLAIAKKIRIPLCCIYLYS